MTNQRGFSLVEIIIATAISLVGLLTVWGIFQLSRENFIRTTSRVEAKESLSIFADRLTRLFSFSQNIIPVLTPPISSSIAVGDPGQVLVDNWDSFTTTPPGTWVRIANFRRETGHNSNATNNRRSELKQTGIFYIMPTPTTAGVLFIDYGNSPGAMSPSYSDIFIPNIVELKIDEPQLSSVNGYLKSFHLHLTIRDFSTLNRAGWRWCPPLDMATVANCATTANYRDLKQDFYITIYNTILAVPDLNTNNLTTVERVLGSIYLFPVD